MSDVLIAQSSSKSRSMLIDSMINDGSKEARVRLLGTVNGDAFAVERAVKVRPLGGASEY